MPSGWPNGFHPSWSFEFGCNDGVLIAPLEKLGISAKGVDISENITEMARAKGLDVTTGFLMTRWRGPLSKAGRRTW